MAGNHIAAAQSKHYNLLGEESVILEYGLKGNGEKVREDSPVNARQSVGGRIWNFGVRLERERGQGERGQPSQSTTIC